MPIKDLQHRLAQVGVIRLGERRVSKNGKPYPVKLDTFRVTSPSESLIKAVAGLFGGVPGRWDSPTGTQYEVITEVREMAVMVPPQRIDPNYEMWGDRFKTRHCDGETERIRRRPCMCAPVRAQADELGRDLKPGEVCRPTTRMSLLIEEVPTMGTFKLESHGWNFAAEMPVLATAVARATHPIPARLFLDLREKKIFHPDRPEGEQVETRSFLVPVVLPEGISPGRAFGGQIDQAAREALVARQLAAIGSAPETPTDPEKLIESDVIRLARLVDSVTSLQTLWKDAAKDGVLTDRAKKALTDRAKELPESAQPAPTSTVPTAATSAAGEPVDAEIVDEPDTDVLWVQIQTAAGKRGWNADALERRIISRFNRSSDEMTGWDMEKFLTEVEIS